MVNTRSTANLLNGPDLSITSDIRWTDDLSPAIGEVSRVEDPCVKKPDANDSSSSTNVVDTNNHVGYRIGHKKPLLMDELIDEFALFGRDPDTPWKTVGPPSEPYYVAQQVLSQQVMSFQIKEEMDLELITKESGFEFPWLYLQFVNAFRERSFHHRLYVTHSEEGYLACYSGTDAEKQQVLLHMNSAFEEAFRQCLDLSSASLRELSSRWGLSKVNVEAYFYPELQERADFTLALERENNVVGRVLSGDVTPYVVWLKAFKWSDHDILMRIATLVFRDGCTREERHVFYKILKYYHNKPGSVAEKAERFVARLSKRGLFVSRRVVSQEATPNNITSDEGKPSAPTDVSPSHKRPKHNDNPTPSTNDSTKFQNGEREPSCERQEHKKKEHGEKFQNSVADTPIKDEGSGD